VDSPFPSDAAPPSLYTHVSTFSVTQIGILCEATTMMSLRSCSWRRIIDTNTATDRHQQQRTEQD
jgi:hypothetical protein